MTLEYVTRYRLKKARRLAILARQRRRALLAAIIAALAVWVVRGGAIEKVEDYFRPAKTYTELINVSVRPGDSLWSVAERYKPENVEIRSFMRTLSEYNELDGVGLRAGQILYIPQ